jgi:SAM-dependent methyltransferase
MDDAVAEQLLALNRTFYGDFAAAFSDSRGATEPGLERILSRIAPQSRVLDLGCGQGRLAALLPHGCTYVGIDYAPEMLRLARERADIRHRADPHHRADLHHRGDDRVDGSARFITADLVSDPWLTQVHNGADPHHGFDWVMLRAVLHHIPGYARRSKVVRRAAQALRADPHHRADLHHRGDGVYRPDGALVLANWQFVRIPRLMRRVRAWSDIGLTPEEVDEGDYLLDWQRDGTGLRYVHLIDEAETRQLALDADLSIEELFFADGHTNDLTLYAVMRP